MIPFKGKTKVAKAYKTPSNKMPGHLKGSGGAVRSGNGGILGNRMPTDLGGDWAKVPYPSQNPK
jgi:hypothetical protein